MLRRPHRAAARAAALALLVAASAVACTSAPAPAPFPPPAPTRDGRWRQDVAYLAAELPRLHVDPFHAVSAEAFGAQADALAREVPGLPDHVIVLRLAALAAALQDGHTRVHWGDADLLRGRYPLGLRRFEDGLVFVSGRTRDLDLLGWRLVAVDDVPVEEACARVARFLSHDSEQALAAQVPRLLAVADLLEAAGIAADPCRVRFLFERPDPAGRADAPERRVLELSPEEPPPAPPFVHASLIGTPPTASGRGPIHWFERQPDGETLLLGYESCRRDPERPFDAFVDALLAEADARPVARLVVDLRRNGGGDSAVMRPLLDALDDRPDLAGPGRLYVLVGRNTYSSAMLNAWELRRRLGAVLVGEPTGGRPNAYGELRSFRLPNSGLEVAYSTKRFELEPGDGLALEPDVPAPEASDDWLAGRDLPYLAALAASRGS